MKENIVLANKSLNKWCNTENKNYYEGIEALGNLFRYAVPKLVSNGFCISPKITLTNDEVGWYCLITPNAPSTEGEITIVRDTPTEALFWAIREIIK